MKRNSVSLSGNILLSLNKITKEYPPSSLWRRFKGDNGWKSALSDISVDIYRGEVFTISGDNGAGKTTLLKIIKGLLSPTSGDITIDERIRDRARIGYSGGSERGFHYRLTGLQNLIFFGYLKGLSKKEIVECSSPHLEGLNMKGCVENRYQTMSAGEKRKLDIIRALTPPNPPLLILDEFGSNIDKDAIDYLKSIVINLTKKGSTTILASTDPHISTDITDRYLHLSEGKSTYRGEDINGIPDVKNSGDAFK